VLQKRTERKKSKLIWMLQKGTKLMLKKTKIQKQEKRRNEIAIRLSSSQADKRLLLLLEVNYQ
jgi:hypothetical protein